MIQERVLPPAPARRMERRVSREVSVACKMRDVGIVAIKSMLSWVVGPDAPAATALMTVGPALFEEILAMASPFASVMQTAGVGEGQLRVAAKFPRVAKKVMLLPT